MPLARQVSELNTKFYRNPSKKLEDMERTQTEAQSYDRQVWPRDKMADSYLLHIVLVI